ncbi:helicase-associated domain-containing protein [Brevibacterium litoralis]|uniref:helicase-associated domain-containing protein n=1 Tax=Brevibacterium litoralis TaxID=3138935 RepID=UPI0032ED4D53
MSSSTPLTFTAWLRGAPDARFGAFCRTRRDLLRTDAPGLRAVAAAAASRSSVALVLESLDTGLLRIVHRAAVAARVEPVVPAHVLGAGPEEISRLLDLGLLWPAHAADLPDPVGATAFRLQTEAVGLLPTSAAERATPPAWSEESPTAAQAPSPPRVRTVPGPIVENAQAAATAHVLSQVFGLADALEAEPASQLVSGGIGKRDVQRLARALDVDVAHAVFLLETAGAAGLLGVGGSETDPAWEPTLEYDRLLAADRAEAWGVLVRAWATREVDTAHVLEGRTGRGDRTHALATVARAGGPSPYGGFPSSRPQVPWLTHLVLLTLADLAGDTEGRAVADADLVDRLRWDHPLSPAVNAASISHVLAEAEAFGLLCTPLADPHAHALTGLGGHLIDDHRTAMAGLPPLLPFDPDLVTVSPGLLERVRELLPATTSTVVLQSDLTAVATGPVDPRVHAQLRRVARVDTRGQGTVYRFTADSVGDALRDGMEAGDVTALLRRISTTGVPQPLTFLLEDAAARLRRTRLAPARSVIVVDDPDDLTTLLADPLLVSAGLERLTDTVGIAQVTQDRLAHLMEAAGRPTLRHEVSGPAPRAPRPPRPAPAVRRTTRVPDHRLESFMASLRSPAAEGSGDAEVAPVSVLDVLRDAAATRTEVDVLVVGSDGTRRTLRLRPTHVSAGRVRAVRRSRAGDTEVTLGISRIVSVRGTGTTRGEEQREEQGGDR